MKKNGVEVPLVKNLGLDALLARLTGRSSAKKPERKPAE